ncbi:unnamed protein product [Cylindrotheca closterium]|uniref:Asparagine synthetase domain-containing protein n=1 Tax=Cylindrotheca closterium TaxID=2856 RepID=A0AAD2CPI1_9STRA|nr:unnamed protein product [Cylindrotheca closterium]
MERISFCSNYYTLLRQQSRSDMRKAIAKLYSKGTSKRRLFSASVVDQNVPPRVVVSHSSNPPAYSQDRVDATNLVDELLRYTRSLMDGSHHHIIAYSGGIDSSLVAALVKESAQDNERVRAVLGLSRAVPVEQVTLAEEVAGFIGIALEKIHTTESSDEMYIENSGQACLACKTHLYSCLDSVFEHTGAEAGDRKLYNGTNSDDLNDPTRLGLIAADSFSVQSPLRLTTKENVRLAAKLLGLPNWNYAASPCLRSRLALGVEAIPQHLERIEQAERHVRQSLSLDPTNNLRVRLLAKGKAMVEVEDKALIDAKDSLKLWNSFFRELGFSSVDVRAFKSGSVAK